jgi:heptosyltransferase-2
LSPTVQQKHPFDHLADLPSKILIIALQGLGNNLFLVPLVDSLRKRFPAARIDMLVFHEATEAFFQKPGLVNHWYFLGKPKIRFIPRILRTIGALRKEKYLVSLLAFPSNHLFFNLVSFLIGARMRISHKYPGTFWKGGCLNTHAIPLERTHDVFQNLHLANFTDWNPDKSARIHCQIPTGARKILDRRYSLLQPGIMKVGIHPGSSSERAMKEKRWPMDRFVQVIDWLLRRKNIHVYVFLGPDEKGLASSIRREDSRFRLVEEKELSSVIYLISKMDRFIANDSGLMNISAALGVPTLDIAGGPTDPVRTYPLGKRSHILFSTIPCYPCRGLENLGSRFKCIYATRRCLEEISVEQVIRFLEFTFF